MGRISKGVECSVSGCSKKAVRSLSVARVKSAGLKIDSGGRRAYICKKHYRDYKKKTKKEKQIKQWRYQAV